MDQIQRSLKQACYGAVFLQRYLPVIGLCWCLLGCSKIEELPNGGLFLPPGFEAVIVVDSLEGRARHLAVNDNGDIYVKLRYHVDHHGNAVLRDQNGDGKADVVKYFGDYENDGPFGTAMRIHQGYLYFSTEEVVYRYQLQPGEMIPQGKPEKIVIDDLGNHEHMAKPVAFDHEGHIYVPFGAPSNACQSPKRTPGAQGLDPCPQVEQHAGVWRFDADKIGQKQSDGHHYARGVRSVVAMDWNEVDSSLYLVMHGRDDLFRLFSELYTPWESALLPSEEFIKVRDGGDYGWPYCYYDQLQGKKVLAPEYGGDGGDSIGRCADCDLPIMGFPGHWAPNDLHFYRGNQFPQHYKNGAFVAFHGSTIRAPYPQAGYFVGFVPFVDGRPTDVEVFADGFALVDPIINVKDAVCRPMGIAMGPDGSLYLSDTELGRIWKVTYTGDRDNFGSPQLDSFAYRNQMANIRQPHPDRDIISSNSLVHNNTYFLYCSGCHQPNGTGATGRFPPLKGTDWVTGDKKRLIHLVLNGMEGDIEVNGEMYNGVMPQHQFLSDSAVADVLTYIRKSFGNNADAVEVAEVTKVRSELGQ